MQNPNELPLTEQNNCISICTLEINQVLEFTKKDISNNMFILLWSGALAIPEHNINMKGLDALLFDEEDKHIMKINFQGKAESVIIIIEIAD